jgi:uncharacterized CHY-type Zn-finger protein
MKTPAPTEFLESCHHVETVLAMISQDFAYRCEDYLSRETLSPPATDKESSRCSPSNTPDFTTTIDAVCREKMAEWSFRVCDHFHVSREIVAMSFSFLDRFVNLCSCDRSAFKLAAMTTLYLAAKVNGAHVISIHSLAELSRGEFEMSNISEMETIILQTLQWKLNPPTAQSFVSAFYIYMPVPQGPVAVAIQQRATFFVELALYDYTFVTKERTLMALAAMMNAMEGMNEATVSLQQQASFVEVLTMTFGLKFSFEEIEATRNRLWYVYSMSAQYQDDDAITPDMIRTEAYHSKHHVAPVSPSTSPVSVARA